MAQIISRNVQAWGMWAWRGMRGRVSRGHDGIDKPLHTSYLLSLLCSPLCLIHLGTILNRLRWQRWWKQIGNVPSTRLKCIQVLREILQWLVCSQYPSGPLYNMVLQTLCAQSSSLPLCAATILYKCYLALCTSGVHVLYTRGIPSSSLGWDMNLPVPKLAPNRVCSRIGNAHTRSKSMKDKYSSPLRYKQALPPLAAWISRFKYWEPASQAEVRISLGELLQCATTPA